MTLVVGRLISGHLRLLSDFRVSRPDQAPGPLRGTLKAIVLDQNFCLSFAGLVEPAMDALRRLKDSTPMVLDSLISLVCEVQKESDGQTDFVLADATNMRFHRVRNGAVESDLSVAWIGDQEAFERYQELAGSRSYAHLDPEWATVCQMADAFNGLVQEGTVASVGEFTITAISGGAQGHGFRYLPGSSGFGFQSITNSSQPTSLLRPVNQEQGGYYYTILTPRQAGVGAIGVYFPQPQLGALYSPLKQEAPFLYRDLSCEEFLLQVSAEHSVELTGILLT